MRIHQRISRSIFIAGLAVVVSGLQAPAVFAQGAEDQTLKEQLDATNKRFTDMMDPGVVKNIETAIQEVTDTGILDKVKKTGDHAPDFTLPDATGENVQLSSLLREGPVILTWYRGNW